MNDPNLIARLGDQYDRKIKLAKRVATIAIALNVVLSVTKLVVGHLAHSTAVFADGIENAGDLFGSGIVLFGLHVAAQPPDWDHPYGHGRSEIIAGLAVGFLLGGSGLFICYQSLHSINETSHRPEFFAVWPMLASIFAKAGASIGKLAYGRKLQSEALIADAHHDRVEIVSGIVALTAVGLSIYDPEHFASADHWGGFAVGLFVLYTAWFVVREASSQLMDVMPEQCTIDQIRGVALRVSGVLGIEKIFARKTGLNYHVELHLQVNPDMAVRDAHAISSETRFLIRKELDWVADVVVHIEPAPEAAE